VSIRRLFPLVAFVLALAAPPAGAAAASDAPAAPGSSAGAGVRAGAGAEARWMRVPRLAGRLHAADIGLVVNTADPYSVAVGAHYARVRGLKPEQVLEVELPLASEVDPPTFERLRERIDAHFGERAQALALAWVRPYAVRCNGLAGALALGFDANLCRQTCAPSRPSPYFNSASFRPLRDHAMRLAMHLAAPSVDEALQLVDRGAAADGRLGLRGAPPVHALFVRTDDRARNVRERLYPPAAGVPGFSVAVDRTDVDGMAGAKDIVLLQIGLARVPHLETLQFAPGALADHLTSFGGRLEGSAAQTSALAWIAAGATASHGTASEPCSHVQKFPHPQVLLLHYLQGATAVEAYWRSVAWPQQAVFVGEPLAAPFQAHFPFGR
jgi:uncharacterized protein (TIGR03790 family)